MGFDKKTRLMGAFGDVEDEKKAAMKFRKKFVNQEVFGLTGRTVKRGSGFGGLG